MIINGWVYGYLMRKAKTVSFVCDQCKDNKHCERRDTWCDCQCRKGPNVPKPEK